MSGTPNNFNTDITFSQTTGTLNDASINYISYNDTVLSNLDTIYNTVVPKFNHNYEFLKFIPNPDIVSSNSIGCAVPIPGSSESSVPMTRIDQNLHTRETCKLAASLRFSDIKYDEMANMNSNVSSATPGLMFKVVDGYFNDNIAHFTNGTVSKDAQGRPIKGIATNFSNIYMATNDSSVSSRPRIDQHNYSVEWTGFIVPDQTGNWTFGTTSDDASYLWVGDNASNPSTSNATVNNGRLHGMQNRSGSMYLIQNKSYPFRMQFGENGGGYNNILYITPPNNASNQYYKVLNTTQGYQMKQMYYSMVENSPQDTMNKLFQCFVTDPNDATISNKTSNINNTITDGHYNVISHGEIWNGLNPATESSIIGSVQSANGITSLSLTDNGQLNIMTGSANAKTLFDVNHYHDLNNNPVNNSYTGQQYLFLYLRGENFDTNSNNASVTLEVWRWDGGWNHISNVFNQINVTDSVPSLEWANQCRFGCCNQNTMLPYILSWNAGWIYKTGITRTSTMISWDGRFKLTISADQNAPNVTLYYAKKPCQNTKTDATDNKFVYTNIDEGNTRFLYKINVEPKMNKMFYANDLNATLQQIPNNNTVLKSVNQFQKVASGLAPSSVSSTDVMSDPNNNSLQACQLNCANDPDCDYLYYYSKGDSGNQKKYCTKGKNSSTNILPFSQNLITPIQSGSGISSSDLYIKDKQINIDCTVKNPIQSNDLFNYSDYNMYSHHTLLPTKITATAQIPGYVQEEEYKDWFKDQRKMLYGTSGFVGSMEGFNGFDPTSCTDPANSSIGCINFIKNNKIDPLKKMNKQYTDINNNIASNDTYLASNIQKYDQMYTDLSNNPNAHYRDATSDLLNPDVTAADAVKNDLNEMIIQQNNMYIVGTIATASLLLFAILWTRKNQ